MMRSVNPVLGKETFDNLRPGTGRMTVVGTTNKTMLLLLIAFLAAAWSWSRFDPAMATSAQRAPYLFNYGIVPGVAAVVVAILGAFMKRFAMIFGPLYAGLEGLLLGTLSVLIETRYPGLVGLSGALTVATLFGLLLAYHSGYIRVTENLKLGIVAGTTALLCIYGGNFAYELVTGDSFPFMGKGHSWMSIGFSLVVVLLAAMNLVLDFDFIESGAVKGSPKYMEWYGAFGIMVTIVWLYVSFLKLLRQLSASSD